MACLNMLNNDQQAGLHATMGPRISFSNDFADAQHHHIKHESSYREAPVSSDFEFSVSGYSMISADELFSKGKLLPLREDNSNSATKTTLRDELLAEDDDNDDYNMDASPRVTKGMSMSRWKERLGLKRSHIHHLPRKSFDKINIPRDLVLERIDETTTTLSFHEEAYYAAPANSKH